MSEFREFLTKTSALALAIGVIIGGALGAVVDSLVNDVIMPPIGYLLGGVDFGAFRIILREATGGDPATEVAIRYGSLLNALIVFVVVALVVFWISRTFIREAPPAPTAACRFCREPNAVDATRCRACTSAI